MTVNEWAKDFKSFVNEIEMPRDDYNGIMEYIDDAIAILKQKAIESINFGNRTDIMANLEGLTWDDWHMYHSDTEVQNIAKSAFDLLIALLKEQEAVEPVRQIEQNEWTVCGNCRNHIISKWIFCPYCGRAVKWDD